MSKIHNPTDHLLFKSLDQAVAANSNGNSLDALAYFSWALQFVVTTQAASAVTVQIQESSDNATWTNITGATFTVGASQTRFNQVVSGYSAVMRRKRYLRAVYSAVAGTVAVDATAILTGPEMKPPTQDNPVVLA